MATSLVEFSATHTDELLGNVVAIIDDVKLFVLLIIAVFLAFHILGFIVNKLYQKK